MSGNVKYLMDCPCGKKVPVGATQAGQSVRCECGRELEVPTLMKLRKLDTTEESTGVNPWGMTQALMTIGVILIILAGGTLIYVIQGKPVAPKDRISVELVEKQIDKMPLTETIQMWNVLRQDIRQQMPTDRNYLAAMKAYKIRFWAASIFLAISIAFTCLIYVFSKRAAQAKSKTGS